MKPKTRILIFAVAFLCAAGCKPKSRVASPQPPTVSVIQSVVRDVVEWDEYIGRLKSPETVEIRARVSGYLARIHFKEDKVLSGGWQEARK